MRLIRRALTAFSIALLVSAPAAVAKNYAPPGRAGTSQYAEDIPSAGGNVKTPAMGGGNTSAAEISKLGAGKAGLHRLSKLGKSGSAAAQFALQTAPTTTTASPARTRMTTTASPTRTRRGRQARPVLAASGGSSISGLGHLVDGSDVDGIGIFLPILLVLSLVLVAVLGALRIRRPNSDAPQP